MIMAVLTINGDITSNDMQEIYDWYGYVATSPMKVREAIRNNPAGEKLIVQINSPGGLVTAGQEDPDNRYGVLCCKPYRDGWPMLYVRAVHDDDTQRGVAGLR